MGIELSVTKSLKSLDPQADTIGTEIAQHLRRERDKRNWSLADLAENSGVSKGTISKIERGEVSPTAVVLSRLAAAFGLTLAGFLLKAEDGGGPMVRYADQPEWSDPQTKYLRRQLFAKTGHPIDLTQIEFPPGQRITFPSAAFGARSHLIWIIAGEIVVTVGGSAYQLGLGDSLGINKPAEVSFKNDTDSPCTYVVATAQ